MALPQRRTGLYTPDWNRIFQPPVRRAAEYAAESAEDVARQTPGPLGPLGDILNDVRTSLRTLFGVPRGGHTGHTGRTFNFIQDLDVQDYYRRQEGGPIQPTPTPDFRPTGLAQPYVAPGAQQQNVIQLGNRPPFSRMAPTSPSTAKARTGIPRPVAKTPPPSVFGGMSWNLPTTRARPNPQRRMGIQHYLEPQRRAFGL